jgi:integrase
MEQAVAPRQAEAPTLGAVIAGGGRIMRAMREAAEHRARTQGRLPSPYLFPADRRDGAIVSVKSTWRRICEAARLEDGRLYDLRHTYATLSKSAGASLPIISHLLGHIQAQTTLRYAHLFDETPHAINDRSVRS